MIHCDKKNTHTRTHPTHTHTHTQLRKKILRSQTDRNSQQVNSGWVSVWNKLLVYEPSDVTRMRIRLRCQRQFFDWTQFQTQNYTCLWPDDFKVGLLALLSRAHQLPQTLNHRRTPERDICLWHDVTVLHRYFFAQHTSTKHHFSEISKFPVKCVWALLWFHSHDGFSVIVLLQLVTIWCR